jgi:hypothetical protein
MLDGKCQMVNRRARVVIVQFESGSLEFDL